MDLLSQTTFLSAANSSGIDSSTNPVTAIIAGFILFIIIINVVKYTYNNWKDIYLNTGEGTMKEKEDKFINIEIYTGIIFFGMLFLNYGFKLLNTPIEDKTHRAILISLMLFSGGFLMRFVEKKIKNIHLQSKLLKEDKIKEIPLNGRFEKEKQILKLKTKKLEEKELKRTLYI